MSFSKTYTSIEEKRVIGITRIIRNVMRGSRGHLISFSNNESFKCIFRIQMRVFLYGNHCRSFRNIWLNFFDSLVEWSIYWTFIFWIDKTWFKRLSKVIISNFHNVSDEVILPISRKCLRRHFNIENILFNSNRFSWFNPVIKGKFGICFFKVF